MAGRGWRHPVTLNLLVTGLILGSAALVWVAPRSILAFMAFQASLLVVYYVPLSFREKLVYAVLALGLVMPALGIHNGYYMEIAIQVGIFVALALGLNIVVGLAGLLDLGYVAFYAVGAYLWAVFASPQVLKFLPDATGLFPLAPAWFFPFLLLGVVVAAITGVLLGLPVLRLRGDYLAIVTLGFGEVIRVLAKKNLDKPVEHHQRPQGHHARSSGRPLSHRPAAAGDRDRGVADLPYYPVCFCFLALAVVGVVILVNRRLRAVPPRAGLWMAIREDEDAAQAMGVHARPDQAPRVRDSARRFAGTMAGGIFGGHGRLRRSASESSTCSSNRSASLAIVILGGMGSHPRRHPRRPSS